MTTAATPAATPLVAIPAPAGDGELVDYRAAVRAMLGDTAPAARPGPAPLHPFVLSSPSFDDMVRRLGTTDPASPPVVVHISQEVTVHRLLRAAEPVTVALTATAARRETRGVRMALHGRVDDATGVPIADLVTTVLLVGATVPDSFGRMPPSAAPAVTDPGVPETVTRSLTTGMIRRYAQVSGDHNPIHLDPAAARAAGFDGVIAHGMSVLALVCELATDRYADGDPARVRGLGCRFSAPVAPGEEITVTFVPGACGTVVTFTCATGGGIALKGGWIALGEAADD